MSATVNARVLIIDDEPTERLLLRQSLENDGFIVKDAITGEDGLALFQQWVPDIVLLDVDMPGIDGFEVCEAIRAHPDGHNLAVVMVTRFDDVESIRRAYAAGATDFITKPINWSVLPYRVRYLMRAAINTVALEKSQIRLASAQRLAKIGYWEFYPRQAALAVSEELCSVFDYEHRSDNCEMQDLLGIIHPEDRDMISQKISQAQQSGTPFIVDHRIVDGGGDIRYVQHQVAVRKDAQGHLLSVIGALQDITPRKRQEDDLRRAKVDVEQANRVKTEFLNNISHEVRTPMNGVLGMLTLLGETTLDNEQRDYLGSALTSAERLLTLLNDLLDFSRLTGGVDEQNEVIALAQLFAEIGTRYDEAAKAKGLRLDVRLEDSASTVGVPLSSTRKILSILMDNAIKFTRTGGVALSGAIASDPVTHADRLIIKVHDTGIGIEPAALSNIFDLFTQEDASTTRPFGGSGVGLALCKKLVDQQHGLIEVNSRKAHGSTFSVTLPLVALKDR